ncbi:MAG: putative DNA binding domain-containing protein [Prevotellaceae bacterium]|jgi:ATP-dependent DNA helicase RecG|nr:putative DNA binding domain-containing protein [Prevotellaceae bacterium]
MLSENQHIEFKSNFNEDVIETLTAIANTKGGKVLAGVANDGKPVNGFVIGEESIQQWLNEIKTKTQPSIIPDAEVIDYKGSNVVEFSVPEFPVKPVACRGRYFKRVKNSNHQLSPIEISDMSMASLQVSWDAYPAHNVSLEDLDMRKVEKFIDKVNSVGRFSLEGAPVECLEKLRLIGKDKVSNAAVLLFAKEGSTYNIHLGRFKTPSMIIDDRMLRLTLFDAVEETQKYLISQMKVAFEVTGKTTQRTEILEYPLPAIRELILNALIHRDYMSPVDVQIRMFDNSITFFNPGQLYGNLTIESLKTNTYQAYARNKLIAEAFYLTGDIEKYGSGFRRIRKELDKYTTMELVCEEVPNGFLATVSYTQQKTGTKTEVTENGERVTEKVTDDVTDVTDNVTEGVANVTDNVTDNRNNQILELVTENNRISLTQLAKRLSVTKMTIIRDINKLKVQKQLQREGSAKGGYWKIL